MRLMPLDKMYVDSSFLPDLYWTCMKTHRMDKIPEFACYVQNYTILPRVV